MSLRFAAGLVILVALDAAGRWIVNLAHIPIPGSVVGMLLLTALIETGMLPVDAVRAAAERLVRHIALLLVPAGVAIIVYAHAVRDSLAAITFAALLSLMVVLVVVGRVAQHFERGA